MAQGEALAHCDKAG